MQLLRHPPGRIVSLPECAGTAVFALFPVLLATNEVWPRFPQLAFPNHPSVGGVSYGVRSFACRWRTASGMEEPNSKVQ